MKLLIQTLYLSIVLNTCLKHVDTINPLLVISIDGFQAAKLDKFLAEYPSSALAEIAKIGIRAKYMEPSFPTLTFPNHVTLVTGNY
jgi:predicted AlkP superfamily pyrophosphatase or phosphodiesterase